MKVIHLPKNDQIIRTVAAWLYEEFGRSDPSNSVDRSIERLKTQFYNANDVLLTLVALDESDSPIGTASIIKSDMKQRSDLSPWLGAVYVLPKARGKGVASLLCKQIEVELRRLSFSKAYLFTVDKQVLYHRTGWQTLSIETLLSGKQATVMQLQIE